MTRVNQDLRAPWAQSTATVLLAAGLIAGTVDIGAAALINLINPLIILHFVAGGLLGKSALQGGPAISALGMLLQWVMSLIITAIFAFAATYLHWLNMHPIRAGLGYGVLIFVVMNYCVVPLSAWHTLPHFSIPKFFENIAAMLLFGLIVALGTRGALAKQPLSNFSENRK